MNKNKEVFIQYMYTNGLFLSEVIPLNIVLAEFERYKHEVYQDWIDDESIDLPRELYEITQLGFDNDMRIATIQFTEKSYHD
jgi:hypothetical protein